MGWSMHGERMLSLHLWLLHLYLCLSASLVCSLSLILSLSLSLSSPLFLLQPCSPPNLFAPPCAALLVALSLSHLPLSLLPLLLACCMPFSQRIDMGSMGTSYLSSQHQLPFHHGINMEWQRVNTHTNRNTHTTNRTTLWWDLQLSISAPAKFLTQPRIIYYFLPTPLFFS